MDIKYVLFLQFIAICNKIFLFTSYSGELMVTNSQASSIYVRAAQAKCCEVIN